jgi:uncharacterized protein YwqG
MGAMQMSDSPLAQAGRDYFSAPDAQTWTALLRPAFHLRALADGRQEPVVAYLGGLPLLPDEVEWPQWKDRGPLYFVAALDCSQVPAADLDLPLPASGQLLFFYFDGLGDSAVSYSDADSVVNGMRVLYVPEDAQIAERAAPQGMTPFPRLLLTGEVIASAPGNEHPALIAAFGGPHDPDDPLDFCDYPTIDPEGAGFWEALEADHSAHAPHHQIGGYAAPVQGAVELEGAHALYGIEQAGGAGAPDEAEIRELASQLVLLAQIDNDSRSGMAWGDAGRLYWMIRREDLAAGRFEKTTFTRQTE